MLLDYSNLSQEDMIRNRPVLLEGLTPIQKQYLNDWNYRFYYNPSGRRSRKTLLNKRKLLYKALKTPNARFFHAAPTRAQAQDIFWDILKADTRLFWRRQPMEQSMTVYLLNGTEICVVGLDKPQRIEGSPWWGCHITEFADVKEGAWGENIRPVLSDNNGFALIDGVPEGRGSYYDRCVEICGGVIPETKDYVGTFRGNEDLDSAYYHWHSIDVLGEQEVAAAKRELDERTFNQEYRGSFVSMSGRCYYAFSEHNMVENQYNPSLPVHIGMDFNRDPMTAVFCHLRNGRLYQFGEAYLNDSYTEDMIDYIERYFDIKGLSREQKRRRFIVHPDSTGAAEKSNSTKSDIAQLKLAHFGVKAKASNPLVRDRVKTMNSNLKSLDGSRKLLVDPSCEKTLRDFNNVESLDDGRPNKKQESKGLVHISDAMGYLVYDLLPIRRGKFSA